MVRRKVWCEVGGFPDLRAAEDLIFMGRIRDAGYQIRWAPNATVWWEMQSGIITTFRRFELYSRHNVWAGRQWDWHYGVARQYFFAALSVLLAVIHSPWWLLVLALWCFARIFRSIWRRRDGRGILWAINPAQLVGVGVILFTIDLATFVGWARAIKERPENKSN